MTQTYVSLDLETTGLNPKQDKIIEIGAVKVMQGEVTDTYTTLINPHRSVEQAILSLTGIEKGDLKHAPSQEEVIPTLLAFIGALPLLGHSVIFDYSFVKKAAVNQSLQFEKRGIDTLRIARKLLPDLESRKLGYLCQYFGIAHQAHRALQDAMATHCLYQKLCESFGKEESKSLEFTEFALRYQVKKEAPASKHQKERLYQLIERHKLITELEIEKLSKNEVSRYSDKILAEYGR